MTTKNDKTLPFTDDFIFSMVMRNPHICKGILERVLPEETVSDIRLSSCEQSLLWDETISVETQKTLKFIPENHGVRFDAFIQSESLWAEIEMQTYSRTHVGKRSRYYHANMDMEFLEAGKPYKDLKKSYVIFICTFDYLSKGAPIYHFRNYDISTNTYLDDDSHTIILNTSCPLDRVPEKLKPLYAYINDPCDNSDSFIKELDTYVQKYNSPEWRQRQMTLTHIIEQERDRINHLTLLLLEADRIEDLMKASKDPDYQKELLEEFDL